MTVDDLNFKTEVSLWKRIKCLPFTLPWQSPHILDLYLIKTPAGKSHDYREAIENEMLAFSNSSVLKRAFEKFRFRDRLLRTVGLTMEMKAAFLNSTGVVRTGHLKAAENGVTNSHVELCDLLPPVTAVL